VTVSLTAAILLALDFRRLDEATAVIPFLLYVAVLLPLFALLLAGIFGSSAARSPAQVVRARNLTRSGAPAGRV
jgi:hypothetical protein